VLKRLLTVSPVALLVATLALADVSLTEKSAVRQPKAEKTQKSLRAHPERTAATGSIGLVDGSGFKWFINTNITFATSSSASAGMSEASYTHAVQASTMGGGMVASTLNDAYDGYQSICVSFTGATGPCATGNANYVIYNKTGGPPTADPACGGRQYIFPIFTTNGIQIQRRVYVPATDHYARWINVFKNTTGSPITFNMITSNNLGSDSNTIIVNSSNGNATAELTDTWVTTFQNFSGTTSSDPRLGHVFRGPGASSGLAAIHFADGDDNPYWAYTITLGPGETKLIMNYAVAEPTKAAAAAKSALLAALEPGALACISPTELPEISNFAAANPTGVPTLNPIGLSAIALGLAAVGFFILRRVA
jgi:hypothetical protein